MKYTLTKRDIGILLGFLGVVIAGLTYYFVYMGYSDKTVELNAANEAMQARVDVLQELVNRQSELVANTERNNAEAQKIMDQFPADYKYEDAILFGIELNEISPFEKFESIAFEPAVSLYSFENIEALASEQVRGYIPAGVVEAPPAEGEEAPPAEEVAEEPAPAEAVPAVTPELMMKETAYASTTDYAGLKNALAYILNNTDRNGMDVTAVYDTTTGMLNNVIKLKSYFVLNTDKVYEEPEIPIVVKGSDDIFDSLSIGRTNNGLNMGESRTNENGNNNNDNTAEASE